MTDDRWEEELAKLIDDHITGIKRSQEEQTASAPEVVELLDIADLLWEAAHGAPPLEQDPVAAMLGLVPDSSRSLNAPGLKQAIQSAGLQVSTLAQKLAERGWDVLTRDVFNWQTRGDATVPPALIQAIADVIGTTPDKLMIDRGEAPGHRALRAVTSSPTFQSLAARWAILRGTTISLGASALEARLAASVFRGSEPNEDQMLASLEALVTALESGSRSDKGR